MRCDVVLNFRQLCLLGSILLMNGIAMQSTTTTAAVAADENDSESAERTSADAAPDAKFADGWRKEFPLAEPNAQGKAPRCIASWLQLPPAHSGPPQGCGSANSTAGREAHVLAGLPGRPLHPISARRMDGIDLRT